MNAADTTFLTQVIDRSGDNFRRCLQCMCCAGGCPVSEFMTYRPNGIIRLIQYGEKEEVLNSPDIWLCVGCNTCAVACPMAIDIPGVMDTLREIALAQSSPISESAIVTFHREVLNSIKRNGRTHKLEIMLRFKMRRWDLFSDMDVGLKMMAKRKLDLLPSKIADLKAISGLFNEMENAA
jgi:heterodisulfide reductase subunit C